MSAGDYGPRPELCELPVDRLFADPAYQREMTSRRSQRLVEAIAAGFRWAKFGVALVTPWPERDGWAVIDGQHRCEAARSLGIEAVPALVYPQMAAHEAAAVFVAVNRNRVAMTPMALHHARLAAGDEHHREIAAVAARAGVEILRYPVQASQMKPGQTMAIGAVSSAIRTHGGAATQSALTVLAEAFAEEAGRIRARTIRALTEILAAGEGGGRRSRGARRFSADARRAGTATSDQSAPGGRRAHDARGAVRCAARAPGRGGPPGTEPNRGTEGPAEAGKERQRIRRRDARPAVWMTGEQ